MIFFILFNMYITPNEKFQIARGLRAVSLRLFDICLVLRYVPCHLFLQSFEFLLSVVQIFGGYLSHLSRVDHADALHDSVFFQVGQDGAVI